MTYSIPDIYQTSTCEECSPENFSFMEVKIKSVIKTLKQAPGAVPKKKQPFT